MLRLAAAILISTISVSHAAEGWITKTEDDIFSGGQTAVMMGLARGNDGIYIDCNSDRHLEFSIITKTELDNEGIPAELVVKIDSGETLRFDAVSYAHNDDYLGFRSTDQESIKSLVREIGKARRAALFGLQIPLVDYKASVNPGVRGSTKAAADFLKACVD